MTAEWPDHSRSLAVLVGTSTYTRGLPAIPAAVNSLDRVNALLTGPLCRWPKDRVARIKDPRNRAVLESRLVELIEPVEDVLVFWYIGHGQIAHGDELVMGVTETSNEPSRRKVSGFALSVLRDMLAASEARVKVVVLDCCFSGIATANRQAALLDDAEYRETVTRIAGAYTLTASEAHATAQYESHRHPLTHFTRTLVEIVEGGVSGMGDILTLDDLFPLLRHRLEQQRLPRPTRLSLDGGPNFAFARNPLAFRPPAVSRVAARSPDRARVTPSARPIPWPSSPAPARSSGRTGAPAGRTSRWRRRAASVTVGLMIAGLVTYLSTRPDHGHHPDADPSGPSPSTATPTTSGSRPTSGVLETIAGPAAGLTISPDGKLLAAEDLGGRIDLFDLQQAKRLRQLESPKGLVADQVGRLAFSGDSSRLASLDADGVLLWNVATGQLSATFLEDTNAVAFSTDGKKLAVVARLSDGVSGRIHLWDVASHRQVAAFGGLSVYSPLAFNRAGTTIAGYGANSAIRTWQVSSGEQTAELTAKPPTASPANAIAFRPDGTMLATAGGDGQVRLWDLVHHRQAGTLSGHTGTIGDIRFSPDGTLIVTAGWDGTVRLWNVKTVKAAGGPLLHTNAQVMGAAFDPDGTRVYTLDTSGAVRFFQVPAVTA